MNRPAAGGMPKKFVEEFLSLYRKRKCLWDKNSPNYKNRRKRAVAFKRLIVKYREWDSKATLTDVRKALEMYRLCYRREWKAILKAKANGEERIPTIWYFNLLDFLTDRDETDAELHSMETGDGSTYNDERDNDSRDDNDSMEHDNDSMERDNDSMEHDNDNEEHHNGNGRTEYMSRKFMVELIQIYRESPCLWKVGSTDYMKKDKRTIAYKRLEEKYREVDPTVNIDMVKNKLQMFRASYRRELRHVVDTLDGAAAGIGALYVPKLWYFPLMTFLSEDQYPEMPALLQRAMMEDITAKSCKNLKAETPETDAEYNHIDSMRYLPRTLITEILEMYRSFECLWRVGCPKYTNRRAKAHAYGELTKKCQTVDATANSDFIRKIIENCRSSYRRELRKVLASAEAAKDGGGEIYVPTLWYFNLMTFLNEDEYPDLPALVESFGAQEPSATVYLAEWPRSKDDTDEMPIEAKESTVHRMTEDRLMIADSSHLDGQSEDEDVEPDDDDDDDKGSEGCDQTGDASSARDLFDAIGESVAHKLRTLKRMQRILAEKLINDVLFNAELERLDKRSTLLVPYSGH